MNTTVLPGYVPQVPMSRILTVPAWRQQYVEMVKKTLAVMQSSEMELRLSKLHSMVKPLVANDPLYSADMAYTLNDFDAAFESRVLKSKFDIGFKRSKLTVCAPTCNSPTDQAFVAGCLVGPQDCQICFIMVYSTLN